MSGRHDSGDGADESTDGGADGGTDGGAGNGVDYSADELDMQSLVTCGGYHPSLPLGDAPGELHDEEGKFSALNALDASGSVPAWPETLYDLLDIDDEDSSGPIHERTTTVFEMERGHASVLQEFRLRPGRWLLWVELDNITCATCGESDGRYLQFAFLERARGVIGECADNAMLDECCKYTSEQVDALHALGWIDPIEGTTPNLHRFATTDDEVAALAVLTMRTLCEVFGLGPEVQVRTMFQERILGERSA